MNEISRCNDDCLRALLECVEGDVEYRRAAAHVETCSECQLRLAEIAADERDWARAKRSLQLDGIDLDITREQTERSWSTVYGSRMGSSWADALARNLLDPPSHPEMLGRLGRYAVERSIGSGGMGVVFKAFDSELNRPVAIKVLAPHLAGVGAAKQRFAREARAAAAIVHEHVVAIHNVETEAEPPFLVMQYVPGESLQERIDQEGALGPREILRIARQTADALAAAHEQGLIHRDVKPSNILLEQGVERALLTDFGLARASDDATLTRSGHLTGTPHYMSPEQARGEVADQGSDLFSLGSVMYTMCTGRPPFRADTSYGVLRKITDSSQRPIQESTPEIPSWLCAVVDKLLAKSAGERFGSAAETAEILGQCLAHVQQPSAHPLPATVQTLVEVRRSRPRLGVIVGLTAAVLVLVAAIAGLRPLIPGQATRDKDNSRPVETAPVEGGDTKDGIGGRDVSDMDKSPSDASMQYSGNWSSDDENLQELIGDVDELTTRVERLWDEP